MELLLAVVEDLYRFAVRSLFGIGKKNSPLRDEIIYVAPRPERVAIASPKVPVEMVLPHAHLESVFEPVLIAPQKNTVVYCASNGAPLRLSPDIGIDNVIGRIPFGAMLVAVETTGAWVHVFHKGIEGYVELHDLADRAAYVHPKFVIGEENHAHDPNTERVRAMIEDEFSYGEGELPLQAEEYVTYKLRRLGVSIPWTQVRPRTPGNWVNLLEGIPSVEVSAEPRPHAVVEWTHEEKSHIAFVEAVFPDGTLQLSEANWPESGTYNERVLVKEEWSAGNPTFIFFG